MLSKLVEPGRNVLILGDETTTETFVATLKDNPEFGLVAVLGKGKLESLLPRDARIEGGGAIEQFVEQNKINTIVVNYEASNSSELERALVKCRMNGVSCHTYESFYEQILEKLPVLMLNDRWFLMSGGFEKLGSRLYIKLKRCVDFAVAALVLVLSLPLTILVSVLIPLTSKGPVFFIQERLGYRKRPFRVIKFRTMVKNAEANGPQWAQKNDGRVTALGKLLRKARIDELPQLINVLKGEMSLIGPRPEREYFVNQLSKRIPFYSLRFFVKPGLSGWAQVKFRYGSDENDAIEKLRYELYYIKNQSLFLDFRIIMKTIRVALTGRGI